MKNPMKIKTCCASRTVTNPRVPLHWSVGTSSGGDQPGYRLSIALWFGRDRFIRHPLDGKSFATHEEASQFMLERGFIEEYRVGWCLVHRRQHWFIAGRSGCAVEHGTPKSHQDTWDRQAPKKHREVAARGQRIWQIKRDNPGMPWREAYEQYITEYRAQDAK